MENLDGTAAALCMCIGAHDCRYFTAFTAKGCRPFKGVPPMCYGNDVPCLRGRSNVLECQPGRETNNPSLPKHGSVVTTSQVYGETFYHFLAEGLTRAMPLLEMILDDKNILVHTYNTAATFVTEAMMLIGVPRERLIQGHGCANVLYIPEPVGCGGPSFEMLHMLRRRLRHELKCPSPRLDFPMQIVLIKREGSRAVGNHYAIKTRLEESLKQHNSGTLRYRVAEGPMGLVCIFCWCDWPPWGRFGQYDCHEGTLCSCGIFSSGQRPKLVLFDHDSHTAACVQSGCADVCITI